MSLKKPRGRTSFCRRIHYMCQPFLYDMSPSSSKARPSRHSSHLETVTGLNENLRHLWPVWRHRAIQLIAADKPRRFFLNQVWFYSYHNILTTQIRARNSRNNAPSWYMLRLITSSAGSISHFIWTLKTQPLLLSLASPTSPWSAFEWWSQWYVFSSRYCTSYGIYRIEGNSFGTDDARNKTFFESEDAACKRFFGQQILQALRILVAKGSSRMG